MPDPEVMMLPMPSRQFFVLRMLRSAAIAVGVIAAGLFIGMSGYHWIGRLGWEESFYYSSMILSGEGPPPDPSLPGAEIVQLHIFAGFYALFSGVTFITMVGVLFAPALHRFLHRFHLEIAAHDVDDGTNASRNRNHSSSRKLNDAQRSPSRITRGCLALCHTVIGCFSSTGRRRAG